MKAQYDTILGSNGQKFSFPKGLLQTMPIYSAIYNKYLNQPQCNIIWDKAQFKIVQGVRQSGKSRIIHALAMLQAVMLPGKTIFITAYKHDAAKCINRDLKDLYIMLPNSKPAVTMWNNGQIEFDNGSRIFTGIANCCSARGLHIDVLLMDEAAFYNEKDVKEFWYSLANGRMVKEIVIVSTRNSRSKKKNFFWRTWLGAVEGTNGFKPFKISNKDCVNERGLKWVKEMKKILGRKAYDREYTIRTK